jgi:8-oxo-dGTP diphosphatase
MSDPIFRYCPMCATALSEKEIDRVRRSVCPECGFIQYLNPKLVVVVVIRYMDKLLLSKRNIEPGKGLWNFCGGFVELGETVQEAAIREVKEEANLDVQLENLIGIYSGEGDPRVVIAYQASILNHQMSSLAPQRGR